MPKSMIAAKKCVSAPGAPRRMASDTSRLCTHFTAIFRFWFDESVCYQHWYGHDEQGSSPRFGIYGSPR
jgi:hypothetical protein